MSDGNMSSTNNDSEDDDPRVHSSGMSSSGGQPCGRRYRELSKSERRKNNKPIMEKKRRARINQCLNELKTLILDALKKDPARHTKLEKADILEMTVRHLQSLHRSGGGGRSPSAAVAPAAAVDPSSCPLASSAAALTAVVVQKFQTGYQECAGEVNRFVARLDGVDEDIKKRLMSHLDSCVAKMRYVPPPPPPPPPSDHQFLRREQQRQLDTAVAALMSGSSPLHPLPPPVGRHRASAFTAVQQHAVHHTPDADRLPFVYCDEPAVSSTSSWAEDAAGAAAEPAVKNGPPLDFSTRAAPGTAAACGAKRPLGDIPVNVPTATAASSSRKTSTTDASRVDGPTTHRPAAGAAVEPRDGSDPNMWRPW